MSFSVISLFIYTPIPWSAILCIVLYRNGLSQVIYPFKDRCSIRDWKAVFDALDIPHKAYSSSGETDGSGRAGFSVERLRADILKGYPDIVFYLSALAVITTCSLLSSLIFVPVLLEGAPLLYSRFGLLISAGLQFLSSIPSIFLLERYFGPFPSPPHKFHLKKRRIGSLLRYEKTLNQQQVKPFSGIASRSEKLWRP